MRQMLEMATAKAMPMIAPVLNLASSVFAYNNNKNYNNKYYDSSK